jgi:non-ribosomal peptide synthetase component F
MAHLTGETDRDRLMLDAVEGRMDLPFASNEDSAIEPSIVSRFRAIADRYPARVAFDDGVARFTYAEAWRIACRLARRIEIVVPRGRPVAIILPNAALFPVAALACLAVGRPYVPIDLDYPAARNAEIMREAGVAAAITQSGLAAATALIPKSLPRIEVDQGVPASDEAPLDFVDADGPAVILFTSGSTGRPKGICNHQSALLLRIDQFTDACHICAEDRFILLSSPSTIAGVRDTFTALLTGVSPNFGGLASPACNR